MPADSFLPVQFLYKHSICGLSSWICKLSDRIAFPRLKFKNNNTIFLETTSLLTITVEIHVIYGLKVVASYLHMIMCFFQYLRCLISVYMVCHSQFQFTNLIRWPTLEMYMYEFKASKYLGVTICKHRSR